MNRPKETQGSRDNVLGTGTFAWVFSIVIDTGVQVCVGGYHPMRASELGKSLLLVGFTLTGNVTGI